jgi:hypothetical protein
VRPTLEWILRAGCALCFVGHGAFGLLQKPAWIPYFAVVGIGPEGALAWMPVIGAWDVFLGVLALTYPRPAVALWMTAWAMWTAALRPLAGEPVWEALERTGNFGVPLALLLCMAPMRSWGAAFAPARFVAPGRTRRGLIEGVLLATVALLLVGHGALSIAGKPAFVHNLASVFGADGAATALPVFGWIEIAMAVMVVTLRGRASTSILLAVVAWKLATESLWIAGGAPVWEWIERGGSYAAPLALVLLRVASSYRRSASSTTPAPTSAIPVQSRVVGRSPRNATANTATSTTLSLSTGATSDASPTFSARK